MGDFFLNTFCHLSNKSIAWQWGHGTLSILNSYPQRQRASSHTYRYRNLAGLQF